MSKEKNERFWDKFFAPEDFDEHIKEMLRLEKQSETYKSMYEQEMNEALREDRFWKIKEISKRVEYWHERIKEVEEVMFLRQLEYKKKLRAKEYGNSRV